MLAKKSALEQTPSKWTSLCLGVKVKKLLWELGLLKSTAKEIPTSGKNWFFNTSPSTNTGLELIRCIALIFFFLPSAINYLRSYLLCTIS